MKRTLRMQGTIYFPMFDGETIEQAEDRLFDALDTVNTEVSCWDAPEILDDEDEEEDG